MDSVTAQGVALSEDIGGHPSVAGYRDDGSAAITF